MTAVLENPTARVKWLAAPSSASWLEQANARPDLVLIDGGAGQLSAAREIMAGLGLDDLPQIGRAHV